MNETQNSKSLGQESKQRISLPLRAKILLGNLLIVLGTVAAMGFYLFYRSQVASDFLVTQFDISVTREIENRLTGIVSGEVSEINQFFSSIQNTLSTFGTTAGITLSQDNTGLELPLSETKWNPYQNLTRLPSGSWDNDNNEPASIFLPNTVIDLNNALAVELTSLKDLDYYTLSLLKENPEIIAIYFGGKAGETVYYPNVDLAAVVPPDFDVTSRPWYVEAVNLTEDEKKAIWSVPYIDAALNGLVITSSVPVYDNTGKFWGVAGIDLKLSTITERISNLSIGKTGYAFLIDSEGRVIAMPSKGFADFNLSTEEMQSEDIENLSLINRVPLDVFEVLAKMTSGQTGISLVELNGTNRYIAYKPVPIIGYSFGIVISENELLQEFVEANKVLEQQSQQTLINSIGVIVILLALASLASYGIGNSVIAPLEKLTTIAQEIASGKLDSRADVTTNDEIGVLGNTLNSMTSTTRDLISNLEGIVTERTSEIETRLAQIQAVAEVGKDVAAQRDIEELLLRTTHLISNRFGFYHAGIFLLDMRGEYAILRSANSSGGAKMLARGHKLRVGAEGIVGTVTGTGKARIALDVGEDAAYFDNPDMPNTRSEMALPLIAGGKVLGALDIQSVDANAFKVDDIPILQVLADQLATAVQNARLLRETQEALIASRKATSEISQRGWQALLQNSYIPGYIGMGHGELAKSADHFDEEIEQRLKRGEMVFSDNHKSISIPIISRGQTIGVMRLSKPIYGEPWLQEETNELSQLAAQIGNALDSARLYSEAQRRAELERVTGEIAASIRGSSNIESILQNTIRELGQKLGGARTYVQLNIDPTNGNGFEEGSAK